jgi:hypothetical protein
MYWFGQPAILRFCWTDTDGSEHTDVRLGSGQTRTAISSAEAAAVYRVFTVRRRLLKQRVDKRGDR